MRKTLNLALPVSIVLASMFVSCKKKEVNADTSQQKLTVADATSYHRRLESKYGNYDLIKVADKTEKSIKEVDFSQAYIGENETSFFVEAPISYTTREIALSAAPDIPTSLLNRMFTHSFDRFVVYRDKKTGMVSDKIVTVIPSIDYLNNDYKDLNNNHYQHLSEDFSGYVSNKDWRGRFLSSQSYNLANTSLGQTKTDGVNTLFCANVTYYRGILRCEDFDPVTGDPVNCSYHILPYTVYVCDVTPPVNNQIPGPGDPYWQGWPDSEKIPSPDECPTWPRIQESTIVFAALGYSGAPYKLSVSFEAACFCYGYSWMILEDVTTGTEYPFPIEFQNFVSPTCTRLWETNVELPAYVPNGEYFVKVWQDGDVFYHQFEQNGLVIRRFRHNLSR